jgi:hypothetical protein
MLMWLAAAALQAASNPPPPPPLHGGPEQMTCPIGGERFEALVTSDYVSSGARPDGRENTFWFAPLPLPECPSNHLVIFREFTPEQIAALRPLIASADYRRLVADDSTYYRAQWLATRIGLPEQDALWMLLRATWQVKPARGAIGQPMLSPAKAVQYQREFVARVRALPANARDPSYVILFERAANAERELGHFANAAAMLRRVHSWLAHSDPAQWEEEDSEPADWLHDVAALRRVVARRDRSAEPLDMADEFDAPWLCIEPDLPATEFNRAFCARPELQETIAENRRLRAEAERETPPETGPRSQ